MAITAQKRQEMRNELKDMVGDGLTHVSKADIEERIAPKIQLDSGEATELFETLKGKAWRGDYIPSDGGGWTGAWIEDVD